jgi:hypothetical protein
MLDIAFTNSLTEWPELETPGKGSLIFSHPPGFFDAKARMCISCLIAATLVVAVVVVPIPSICGPSAPSYTLWDHRTMSFPLLYVLG